MTAKHIHNELDLAAWEIAEAEAHERRASGLRKQAINRLAKLSVEIKEGTAKIREARNLTEHEA